MGILNVTPDSFADGGAHLDPGAAEAAAVAMEAAGADIIDIGGESTRPGASAVPVEEELARVRPVLMRLVPRLRVPLSVDTSKPEVAEVALGEGVSVLNEVSGLRYDAALADIAARHGAALILMHSRGRPREMYREAQYASVAREVRDELAASMERAVRTGVRRESIVLDPGLGFAKRAGHSFEALAALPDSGAAGTSAARRAVAEVLSRGGRGRGSIAGRPRPGDLRGRRRGRAARCAYRSRPRGTRGTGRRPRR